eukprot:927106-Pelagomonas_calceolata.AAC.3
MVQSMRETTVRTRRLGPERYPFPIRVSMKAHARKGKGYIAVPAYKGSLAEAKRPTQGARSCNCLHDKSYTHTRDRRQQRRFSACPNTLQIPGCFQLPSCLATTKKRAANERASHEEG